MKNTSFSLRRATIEDVNELLTLYFTVYGTSYPLELGTDRHVMISILSQPCNMWNVAVDNETKKICGSIVFEVDALYNIARAEGMVVHPEYQKRGIAFSMLNLGTQELLRDQTKVNSIYTTTRTTSMGPQLTFLKSGFLPLGIFPNAHRLEAYETLTLMAKFREGVLEKRRKTTSISEVIVPILKTLNDMIGPSGQSPEIMPMTKPKTNNSQIDFELIFAPSFVRRKFLDAFHDPYDRFYPFHSPNFLISAKSGEVDIFSYLSQKDGYCTLICLTQPTWTLAGRLRKLMEQLRDFGVSYLEILIETDNVLASETLLDLQFLPSAIYPAMLEQGGEFIDLVLMSRTLEPLDFRGMQIEKTFKPYIDQYIELWKKMHLEVLGVFDV